MIKLDLPGTTDSYKSYWQRAIVADIKETVCRVPDTAFDGNDSFLFCMSGKRILDLLGFAWSSCASVRDFSRS